jgi:anthranilate synthase component 1
MVRPDAAEFETLAQGADLVPVVGELIADLETPISLWAKLAPLGAVYLLESAEQGARMGRYSFIGVGAALRFEAGHGGAVVQSADGAVERLDGSPLLALRTVMSRFHAAALPGLPRFWGGAVGYFGYGLVHHLERLPRMAGEDDGGVGAPGGGAAGGGAGPASGWPVASFVIADTVVVVDHLTHRLLVVAAARIAGEPRAAYRDACQRIERVVEALRRPAPVLAAHAMAAAAVAAAPAGAAVAAASGHRPGMPPARATDAAPRSNLSRADFEAMVTSAQRYIRAGDIFQVVLSQRLERPVAAPPMDVYRVLRSLNPSPYMFYLDCGDRHLVGASPEMLLRVEDGWVETRPIAGTRPRGRNEHEDAALAKELLADAKERAEHVMLVDLGRNDVGRVSAAGSVQVPELMVIERYSHVMHIVSSVRGRLRPDCDAFQALGACFPAGTLSGAPKVRAMEIIAELEPSARGPYGGTVGYFGFNGSLDACITIRTAAIAGGVAAVQAGAGIVADSDPGREYQESLDKASAMMRAIAMAEEGVL